MSIPSIIEESATPLVESGWEAALAAAEGEFLQKPPLEQVLARLENRAVSHADGRLSFLCPLHIETNPSAWLRYGYSDEDPERYTVRCYGCGDDDRWFGDFVRWINGMEPKHHWESKPGNSVNRGGGQSGRREYVCSYYYLDANGECVASKMRWNVYKANYSGAKYDILAHKTFTWDREYPLSGRNAPMYRLPELLEGIRAGQTVYLVEGEKDADTMASLGYLATSSPVGAGTPLTESQVQSFAGAALVIIADHDGHGVGQEHALAVAEQLRDVAATVELKVSADVLLKDVTDIHEAGLDVLSSLVDLKPTSPTYRPHINPMTAGENELQPKYLLDSAGRAIIYPGEIHLFYGRPGTMKSWLLLYLATTCDARVLDFENGIPTVGKRLWSLGLQPDRACFFDFPTSRADILERVDEYVVTKPEVVCIDGLPGLCRVYGVDSDSNHEVEQLYQDVLFPLKNAGIAVVMLDHLTKDGGNEDYPIGAQAKKSQAGVAYLLKTNVKTDCADMYITKDRHHTVESRTEDGAGARFYGSIHLTDEGSHTSLILRAALTAEIDGRDVSRRDASLLETVYKFIEENPNCSKSAIESGVSGKHSAVRDALQRLIAEGNVGVSFVGQTHCHSVIRPLGLLWKSGERSTLRSGALVARDYVDPAFGFMDGLNVA